MTRRVLIVDDDAMVRAALAQSIELAGLTPITAGSYIEAKDHVGRDFPGVVLSDIRMPGKDGFALLAWVRKLDPDLPVILLTGEGDIPMAVRGMKEGAFGFLEKPCEPDDLIAVLEKALGIRAMVLGRRRSRQKLRAGDAAARLLHGTSEQAEELRRRVRLAARTRAEVLICGEPGSGTSKVADAIHQLSGDASRPFVKLASAGLDTARLRAGLAEAAGGALFLDEVAALSPEAQFALLDALERPSHMRLMAGTYRDLAAEAGAGRFNADLFYRLDIMRIRIPALRERVADIPILFRHYVDLACEQAGLARPEITPALNTRLMARDWPGNARALMNAAMRFAMGLEWDDDAPDPAIGEPEQHTGHTPGLTERLAQVERSMLVDALERNKGAASAAARELKLPRKTFYDKLARHRIRPEQFRG
ncbi:MAG TPA: sigma-54-dependent Fis family transcriptional regulator [Aliiroseovarius sp.]|nr:sigma-54-dependent Fis family transcriptional regulator [Aliiroseovarius sp.]